MIREGKYRNDGREAFARKLPGKHLGRIAARLSMLALAAWAGSAQAGQAGEATDKAIGKGKGEGAPALEAKADSLRALRVLLSGDAGKGDEILRLKDARRTDSLLSHATSREAFLKGLRDSAVSRSIRGPEEFRAYWDRIEKENGIGDLREQMAATHDLEKGRIPKTFLFDSSVVVYPGWIIVRRMHRR